MADFDFTNLTIQECIEAKALLDNRLEELGEGKSYKSLEQKAMVLRQVKDNFASFLAQYGITLTSDKVSSEWIEKFKEVFEKSFNKKIVDLYSEDITQVMSYAYFNSQYLKTINLPNCIKILAGAFAFKMDGTQSRYYSKLVEVNLPNCLTIENNVDTSSAGIGAFQGCTKLTTVNIPETTRIDRASFAYCTSLTTISAPKCTNLGYGNRANNTAYGQFQGCTKLTTVDLPICQTIGIAVFYGCTSLKSVEFNEVTLLGSGVFNGCTSLESVSLPKWKNSYDYNTLFGAIFIGCSNLKTVYAPLVRNMGANSFSGCTSLEELDLPSYIGDWGSGNTNVPLDLGLASCTKLRRVNLPECLTFIQSSSGGSNAMEEFNAPKVKLGQFNGVWRNPYITNIDLVLNSLERLTGSYSMGNNTSLRTISLPNCYDVGSNNFRSNSNLLAISIPKVQTISTYDFYGDTKLKYVYAPSCTFINQTAFDNCKSLEMVNIGIVNTISTYAFRATTKLRHVYIGLEGNAPTLQTNAFQNNGATATNPIYFHVKEGCSQYYTNANNWKTGISSGQYVFIEDYDDYLTHYPDIIQMAIEEDEAVAE